jgi:aspartate 1-decarboxylase
MLSRTFLRALIVGGTAVMGEPEGMPMVTVDAGLLDAADLDQLERVELRALAGGPSLDAVLLRGPLGSGMIRIDGGGHGNLAGGGRVVIAAWSTVDRTELPTVRARIVAVDADNRILQTLEVQVAGSDGLPPVP